MKDIIFMLQLKCVLLKYVCMVVVMTTYPTCSPYCFLVHKHKRLSKALVGDTEGQSEFDVHQYVTL